MGLSLGGILSGAARAAGAAPPAVANTMAARLAAQAQGQAQQRQQLLQLVALQQQMRREGAADLLAQSQARHFDAETTALQNKRSYQRGPGGQIVDVTDPANIHSVGPAPIIKPSSPVMGSPEWLAAQENKAKITAKYRPPREEPGVFVTGPDGIARYTPRNEAFGQMKPIASGVVGTLAAPTSAQRPERGPDV